MKKKKIAIITTTVIGVLLFSMVAFVFFGTKTIYKNKTIEVGTILSNEAQDYLDGNSWLIEHAKLDFSNVDMNTPGEYPAFCNVFFKKHKFTVNVVAMAFDTKDIELGSKPETNIASYLLGDATFINEAKLDINGVNYNEIGKYDASVQIDDLEFQYEIRVVDTTAPILKIDPNVNYIAMMREYDADTFVKSVFDLSDEVELYFETQNGKEETITFDEMGEVTINLVAKDSSGNTTKEKMSVMVDIAPIILGVYDTYVVVGETYDEMDNMLAYDNEEGNITDRVTVSNGSVNTAVAGEYTVTYVATDKNGLTTEKAIQVYVCDGDKKSEYAHLDEKKIPESDLMLLCETDYFSTKPLEQEDREKALEMIVPASLRLGKKWTNAEGFGSGFIYDITPEYTYILSVYHVIDNYRKNCDIMFFDDSEINVDFDVARGNNINELVLIRIETDNIPTEILLSLKEAYVDENVYDDLTSGQAAIEHSENWGFDNRSQMTKDTSIIMVRDSLEGFKNCCITTKGRAKHGMSGCALIDLYGRVIGSASHIYKGVDYFMRIENLDVMVDKLNGMQ